MAKQSMINREAKRARTVEQYAARRAALKETIRDPASSDEQRGKRKSGCRSCHAMRVRYGCTTVAG